MMWVPVCRWSRLPRPRLKPVSILALTTLSVEIQMLPLAGGDNLKTTINKNGKPTVVPDYATVRPHHRGNSFHSIHSFIGTRHPDRSRCGFCDFHHHHRTGVRVSGPSPRHALMFIYFHVGNMAHSSRIIRLLLRRALRGTMRSLRMSWL